MLYCHVLRDIDAPRYQHIELVIFFFSLLSALRYLPSSNTCSMSGLRRRIFGPGDDDSSPGSTRAPSPAPAIRASTASNDVDGSNEEADLVSVPLAKLQSLNSYVNDRADKLKTRSKHGKGIKKRYIFGLGGIFGLLLAGFFAANETDVFDLSQLQHMNLDSIIDVLPAGLIKDAHELQVWSALDSPVLNHTDVKKAAYMTLSALTEKGKRHGVIRLVRRRAGRTSRRNRGNTSCHHDTRRYLDWT